MPKKTFAPEQIVGRRLPSAVGTNTRRRFVADSHSLQRNVNVPVIGQQTIAVMRETGTTALAIDAGRTLLIDRAGLQRQAGAAGIASEVSEP